MFVYISVLALRIYREVLIKISSVALAQSLRLRLSLVTRRDKLIPAGKVVVAFHGHAVQHSVQLCAWQKFSLCQHSELALST